MSDPIINEAVGVSDYWREYTSADYGREVSLVRGGTLPRRVVMKEAGDLRCTTRHGLDGTLTGLPQWYVHDGAVLTLSPAQTAAVVVYW